MAAARWLQLGGVGKGDDGVAGVVQLPRRRQDADMQMRGGHPRVTNF